MTIPASFVSAVRFWWAHRVAFLVFVGGWALVPHPATIIAGAGDDRSAGGIISLLPFLMLGVLLAFGVRFLFVRASEDRSADRNNRPNARGFVRFVLANASITLFGLLLGLIPAVVLGLMILSAIGSLTLPLPLHC